MQKQEKVILFPKKPGDPKVQFGASTYYSIKIEHDEIQRLPIESERPDSTSTRTALAKLGRQFFNWPRCPDDCSSPFARLN